MPSEWPQRAVGKLVESPGGPIRPGPDYFKTGESVAFPEFPAGAAPTPAALGVTDRFAWRKYPAAWPDGGLFLRPATTADGTPAVVVSRVCPREEEPGKPNGRIFVEIRHAVHPVATLDFGHLFLLPDRLRAESLMDEDKALPPLLLDGPPPPLPGDWFAQCRAYLEAVAGGGVLHVREMDTPVETFFHRALWAVACLPGAVRWRVPVAAGAYALPKPEQSPTRYALTLTYEVGEKAPGDPATGAAYVQLFADATDNGRACKTVADVLARADELNPNLAAWGGLPATESAADAVRSLSEAKWLGQLDACVADPTLPPPPVARFNYQRERALARIVAALGRPAAVLEKLLPDTLGPDWQPAWERLLAQPAGQGKAVRAAAQLLGTLAPLDPAAIADGLAEVPFELPVELTAKAHERLSAAFRGEPAAWQGILRRAFAASGPVWFAGWVKTNRGPLLWRSVQLGFDPTPVGVMADWTAAGAPAAAKALLGGTAAKSHDFHDLLEVLSAAEPETLKTFLTRAADAAPAQAVEMAVKVKRPPEPEWVEKALAGGAFDPPADTQRAVRELLSAAVAKGTSADALLPWAGVVRRAFASADPKWFADWARATQKNLVWAAVRLRFDAQTDVTGGWDAKTFRGAPAAVKALLGGAAAGPEDFRDLVETLSTAEPDLLTKFLKHAAAASPQQAVRMAVNVNRQPDPTWVEKALELGVLEMPKDDQGELGKHLSAAVAGTVPPEKLQPWAGVVRRAFAGGGPEWFAKWARASGPALVWAAVRLRFEKPPLDVTGEWDGKTFPGAPAAVKALLALKAPTAENLEALIGTARAAGAAITPLLDHVVEALPLEAVRLAVAADATRWLNPRLQADAMRTASDGWVRAVAGEGARRSPLPDAFANGLMTVWESRLTDDERKRLKRLLAPFLGYLDTILFGDEPVLDPARPPAEKAWPIAERMCKADPQRRRNVLRAAADNPRAAKDDKEFCGHLLNPTLQGPDVAADAATVKCPTLEFAVSLLKGPAKPFPRAATRDDIARAELWLELFSRKPVGRPPAAPPLEVIDQYPISVLYRDHVRGKPDVEASFWCQWVRMIVDPKSRAWYHLYASKAGDQDRDFFRFAAGWKAVVEAASPRLEPINPKEEERILDPGQKNLFESYLAAVVEGAPLTYDVCRAIRTQHIETVCETAPAARALYERCVELGDEFLAVRFWHVCTERMEGANRTALTSEMTSGGLRKLFHWSVSKVRGSREIVDEWYHLAVAIFTKSSPKSQERIMDKLAGKSGGTPSGTVPIPKKRGK